MTNAAEKNPVIKGTRFAFKLMKNKLVISLLMIVQGLLFIFYPSGNVGGLIQTAAVIVIAATVINVLLHLLHKDRTAGDYLLAVLNIVLCVFAVFCLVLPGAIEPYVRAAVGAFTIGANLVSLVEVLRYENKKSWRFIVGIIAAIVMIVLGAAMIIAPENIIANIRIGIGWILILNAVINVWYIIRLYFVSKDAKQEK